MISKVVEVGSTTFKRESGIHSVVRHRETANVDKATANKFGSDFRIITEEGEYLPQQVFNWKKRKRTLLLGKKSLHHFVVIY